MIGSEGSESSLVSQRGGETNMVLCHETLGSDVLIDALVQNYQLFQIMSEPGRRANWLGIIISSKSPLA